MTIRNTPLNARLQNAGARLKSACVRQNIYIPILAVLIGVTTAILVALFRFLLDFIFNKTCDNSFGAWLIVFPIIGGLLTGIFLKLTNKMRSTSVESISGFIASQDNKRNPKEDIISVVASLFTIGFGGSLGPEAPSAQIGAASALGFGNLFKLTGDDLKTLVGCGVASGISAAFNAPISGVIFVIEVVYKKLPKLAFGVIILSSAVSAACIEALSGRVPAFFIPNYTFEQGYSLGLYCVLGIGCALLVVSFNYFLEFFERRFDDLQITEWLKPALGGLLVGILGYLGSTDILGIGYSTIEKILTTDGSYFIIELLALKFFATIFSLSSKGQGGLIAPSLFLGACFGKAFGLLVAFATTLTCAPSSFALVGMGAVVAGMIRAPMLGVVLVFELTYKYQIILPISVCVASTLIVIQGIDIFTQKNNSSS